MEDDKKTNSRISSISGLQMRVKRLVKTGMSKEKIITFVTPLCNTGDVPNDIIEEVVQDVIDDYPNYELIQKVMRSRLVEDIKAEKKMFYLVDYDHQDISHIAQDRLKSIFHRSFSFGDRVYTAVLDYYPHNHRLLIKQEKGPWVFNSYNPPFWLKDVFFSKGTKEVEIEKNIPKPYEKFLMHLLDNDVESYEYVLDWLATAITSRNYCMLCTIGARGIGKGVLGEVMKEVVGVSNFHGTDNRIMTTNFNSQIENKKIVYIDEISVSNSREEDVLKTLINDYIEIEQKGIDAKYAKNHASIYISSNNLESLKLAGDNRRFSIVNLTDDKLINVMSKDEISNLVNDKDLISKFSRYLYHREVDDNKMLKVFTSSRTEEVRFGSLKDWEHYLIFVYGFERIGQTILCSDIVDHIKNEQGLLSNLSQLTVRKLAERFPEFMKVTRPASKEDPSGRVYKITFLPHAQP